MCLNYFCDIVALTPSRHSRVLKSFQSHPRPLENGNEGKKNKKLEIPLPEAKCSGLRSDCKPRLQAASTRKNYIRRRRLTSPRAALRRLSTGLRLEGGERSTSNKIAKSGKISRGASHQKNWDKKISYRNITLENHSEKCTLFLIYIISLQGRSPPLLFAASNRNQASKHLAINYHREAKAPNTIIQTMKSDWSKRAATCAIIMILMMIIQERI